MRLMIGWSFNIHSSRGYCLLESEEWAPCRPHQRVLELRHALIYVLVLINFINKYVQRYSEVSTIRIYTRYYFSCNISDKRSPSSRMASRLPHEGTSFNLISPESAFGPIIWEFMLSSSCPFSSSSLCFFGLGILEVLGILSTSPLILNCLLNTCMSAMIASISTMVGAFFLMRKSNILFLSSKFKGAYSRRNWWRLACIPNQG